MPRRLVSMVRRLQRDSRGVAALEWAILSAAIVITVATSMPGIKTSLTSIYTVITTALG